MSYAFIFSVTKTEQQESNEIESDRLMPRSKKSEGRSFEARSGEQQFHLLA
jgi:hypothetical protein